MNVDKTMNKVDEKYQYGNPFDLNNNVAFDAWVQYKMEDYPQTINDVIVEINDPKNLTAAEFSILSERIKKANMVVYASNAGDNPDKDIPEKIAQRFRLFMPDNNRGADDGITALRVASEDWRGEYIPYTNKSIHWHTDGYYNPLEKQINALLLHCVCPAASGGENALLDHEIIYIHLRQHNPEYIRVLMQPDVMMIPANVSKDGEVIRPDRYGPVFSISEKGDLHMRYTARIRSIKWKADPLVQSAVALLNEYLHTDSPYIYRGRLQSGQGLISNNVLHDRSGFENNDTKNRLLYRMRYYQRVANT